MLCGWNWKCDGSALTDHAHRSARLSLLDRNHDLRTPIKHVSSSLIIELQRICLYVCLPVKDFTTQTVGDIEQHQIGAANTTGIVAPVP